MLVQAAIAGKPATVSEDQSVEKALSLLEKSDAEAIAVVDAEGRAVGLFSLRILLKNLLPVSVAMKDGTQLDLRMAAAPGIGKRLKNALPMKVSEVMERKINVVPPEAVLWEGINILIHSASPLVVADSKTHKALGLVTVQSVFETLSTLKDEDHET